MHIPVTEAKEGEDLQIVFTVENIKRGTKAYLCYKKAGEISYQKTEMKSSDNSFKAVIPKADIRNGYNQYYIEVSEPHDYFDYITVTVPKEGPESPFSFNIIKLKDLLFNEIDFTKLPDVEYGIPVNVSIR